ncbi:Type 1 glutamine amidotransferase-like domain-containing protein [Robertmurraya sp. Marseille-Q9965]
MKNRHLFLFGGSPPFTGQSGEKFASHTNGKVAILFLERDGWKEYMPKYTSVLENQGIRDFLYLPLTSNPDHSILNELISCSGVIIGGGDTELYRDYIVDTEIGFYIKRMYQQGIPVAGFSAGALISPSYCVIPPIDNSKKEHLFLQGLGLLEDCVVSVHYTKWNEETNLKAAMAKLRASVGYGIDDEGYLYFENEQLIEAEKYYKFT